MSEIKQQSCAASAAHVLATPSLAWLVGEVTPENVAERIEFVEARYAALSSGEQLMVRAADGLLRDGGGPQLVSLMIAIDDDCLKRVIEAMIALRPNAAPDVDQAHREL